MSYRNETDESIVVVGMGGRLLGLDRDTGAIRWENGLEGGGHGKVFIAIVALPKGQHVLAASKGRRLFCVRYDDGETVWATPTRAGGKPTILVEHDRIFVSQGGHVTAFAYDGTELWTQPLRGRGIEVAALGVPGKVVQGDAGDA